MNIGKINSLQIKRFSPHGAYLGDINISKMPNDIEEVLLPNKFIRESKYQIGDNLRVFVYMDHESRPVATTQIPLSMVDEIALLKIVSISDNGCYLDIGLDKDIFMPSKNPRRFAVGQNIAVVIKLDKSKRLIAKLGIKEHLRPAKISAYERFSKLSVLCFEDTPLGIGCVVDGMHYGLLYHNEMFTKISLPSRISAYVKAVRKDGKLDLSLYPDAISKGSDTCDAILQALEDSKMLNFNYDSLKEDIYATFHVSKKEFKRALSTLISSNKIILKDGAIYKA